MGSHVSRFPILLLHLTQSSNASFHRTIKYDEDNSSYRWGYQIDEADLKHEWFKLGLYPELTETGLAKKYPSRTALPPVTGSDCEQLVTDYLKALKKHAEKYITNKFGTEFLKNKRPEYIITVPAVWSEKAQETTRSCAEKAGMQVTGTSSRIQVSYDRNIPVIMWWLRSKRYSLLFDSSFFFGEVPRKLSKEISKPIKSSTIHHSNLFG